MLVSGQFKDDLFLMGQEKTLCERIMEISTEPVLFAANDYIPFQFHIPSYTCGLIAGENWYERRIDFYFTNADGGVIEPLAYSYNGVRLPALPETDLPNKVIVYSLSGKYVDGSFVPFGEYRLFASINPFYVSHGGSAATADDYYIGDLKEVQYWYCSTDQNTMEWENNGTYSVSNRIVYEPADPARYGVVWSNLEIPNNSEGGVYHEASEPIPIYE